MSPQALARRLLTEDAETLALEAGISVHRLYDYYAKYTTWTERKEAKTRKRLVSLTVPKGRNYRQSRPDDPNEVERLKREVRAEGLRILQAGGEARRDPKKKLRKRIVLD